MTPVELRLRERIDKLTDERDLLRALIPPKPSTRTRRCVYCGRYTQKRACGQHTDLLRIDPLYAAA